MEELLLDILALLREGAHLDAATLARLVRARNVDVREVSQHVSKKGLHPFYLRVKRDDPERWRSWEIDESLERRLLDAIRVKPRRTASGVATITVIARPWPCGGDCLFCPNDVRMPKSYLSDEPACQRAERCFFDPFLQVSVRLAALGDMGHPVDKVELIVLGGTWCDYPAPYRRWFVRELFAALNCSNAERAAEAEARRARYRSAGLTTDPQRLAARASDAQQRVNEGRTTYAQALAELYGPNTPWHDLTAWQQADQGEVECQHRLNERAAHRVVGLVVETRPERVSAAGLAAMRQLGCTKVQIGVQTLDERALEACGRLAAPAQIARAFALIRLHGFKIHAHLMPNLPGSDPAADLRAYRTLTSDPRFCPDEVKLYPCMLVEGTRLGALHENGRWTPYDEATLTSLLAECVVEAPPYLRISRMVRDISAHDIVAGVKRTNLRQQVERAVRQSGRPVDEVRYRELATDRADARRARLRAHRYDADVAREVFLEWVLPDERILGFLRLSLPTAHGARVMEEEGLPTCASHAMIREVHVYGAAAPLHRTSGGAQHQGLGRALVERACRIAQDEGFAHVSVISAVGTRDYYRRLGFRDDGMYQSRDLGKNPAQDAEGPPACDDARRP
ncbi:tRNA uridine(34) 5-carboxymethylaminomethyl modification radical SAM/GNAT enzyme Elp3 [Eggerthellaceae bacterium zg-1084]|uniref:elongator complex protein 3 n=1 Tax=Berryella wangjianweii TaxID=2734634 RepID=UPI001554B54C|nr:tRNA uridine(34) 5-carboxymethylaminomethyl modification radical SAM/GNAT enzyme Elp3 [Berryella wangjianweii]NPD31350.1 tRNA uridine(34) 5-carboxymethylaminomethyl modification radical SAM/GNAT enzyme Elp3 [Berryella wangjianweii]NPD32343.1 tRNA uridine(34) 5-carboxymethylaminomethyl modification radical SAM/GNAT enzyme Elp3 [Eggerthellaceae bacterium zg-997]